MVRLPPTPMLASLSTTLPVGSAWRYEPKLDGFRGLLDRECDGRVWLTSRNAKELLPWFPELGQAAKALPAGTVLDGEIVIADEDGATDFGALQDRLGHSPCQLARRSSSHVAVLVVFDLLVLRGREVLDLALSERGVRSLVHSCPVCIRACN